MKKCGLLYDMMRRTRLSSSQVLTSGGIAQSVEQRTENPCVPGSIPGPATIFLSIRRMVTRHSAFFLPCFEVELQGFISISAKRRI